MRVLIHRTVLSAFICVYARFLIFSFAIFAVACGGREEAAEEREIADAPQARSIATPAAARTWIDEWRAAGVTITPADAWPMFRGNEHQTGVSAADLPEKLSVLWSFKAGDAIDTTAAIAEGVVYFGSFNGSVYAVDLQSGRQIWETKSESAISSSVTVAEGRVFYGDDYGMFHALDAKTGQELWHFETDAEIISSPTVLGDRVLFGSYDQFLYNLKVDDGSIVWKFETEGPVHCSPGIGDGKTFVSGCDGMVRAIDVATGQEIGRIETGANSGAAPASLGDLIFAGNHDYKVMAFDIKKFEIRWIYDPPKDFPFESSAAVAPDRIVVGGRDKVVHCIAIANGEPIWTFPTRARVISSPVIVEGRRVFIGSADGNLYELDLETGAERWKFETGAPIAASPAIVEGRLIIGDQDGILYCLGAGSGAGQ